MIDFCLRPWESQDLDSLVRYANNKKIADFMTNKFPHPYTEENGRMFIEFARSHAFIMAIEVEGKACGGIGLHPQDDIQCKNAELGYWLAEAYWGQGIITRAILQMLEYGFKNLDIDRIFARPFGSNRASQRVLEKTGFKLEARFEQAFFKNGEYLDELVYGFRRGQSPGIF
jgi:ribosomal-protein-alanine N-acetyltransferase